MTDPADVMPSDANFIQCVCLTFVIPLHNVEIRRR